MAAYWIARVTVTDEARYGEYRELAGAAVAAYGGTFLARGGRHVTKEGDDYARNVIVQFPSYGDAVRAYESPEYQEALAIALQASTRQFCIVEG